MAHVHTYVKNNEEKLKENNIHFTQDHETASYQLIAENGEYIIASAWDDRPLIQSIKGYSDFGVKVVMSKFRHIAQWVFTKNIKNPEISTMMKNPIQLKLHSSKGEEIIADPEKGPLRLKHLHPDESDDTLKYAFHFVNRSYEGLHVACLYLDKLFQVEVNYLQPNVVYLGPGDDVWGINGNKVPLRLPAYIREF